MNKNEEYKNYDNEKKSRIETNTYQKQINNTDIDIENLSNKSHKIQRPIEILSKYQKLRNKNDTLNIFKVNFNESGISLETFKTMFKNRNRE